MNYLNLIILFSYLLISYPGFSQKSTHISLREGLKTNALTDITTDSDGCVWIATYSGIYKHEGTRIRPITENTANNIPIAKSEVHTIIEDSDGMMWAGGLNGLYKIDKYTFKTKHFPIKPFDKSLISIGGIYSVFEGYENDLWISSDEGMYIFDKKKETIKRVPSGQDKKSIPNSVASYKTGVKTSKGIWFYTKEGMVFYNKRFKHFEHKYHNPRKLKIFELAHSYGNGAASYTIKGQKNDIWFVADQKWLTRYDTDMDEIATYHMPLMSETWACCQSVALDTIHQMVWVGTRHGGLFSFDMSKQEFKHYTTENAENVVSSNYINAVTFDRYNQLWIGSDNGVNILDNINIKSSASYVSNEKNFLNLRYQCGTISLYNNKDLFIPYRSGPTFIKDIKNNTSAKKLDIGENIKNTNYIHIDEKNKYYTNTQIIEDKNNPQKGYIHGVKLKNANHKLSGYPGFIIGIYAPTYGKILVRKNTGHLIYIDNQDQEQALFCYGFKKNMDVCHDRQELWYLGDGYALIKKSVHTLCEDTIHLGKYLQKLDWSFTNPRDLLIDKNSIWITSQNGLLRYYTQADSVAIYTVNDGLSASFTFVLNKDNFGHVWVGSLGGIDRFDEQSQRFTNGINWPVNTYMDSFASTIKDDEGQLHFVIGNKYIQIFPEKFNKREKESFEILFNKFAVNGQIYNVSQPETFANLNHNQNRIEINFGLLNFTSRPDIKLKYHINDNLSEWMTDENDGIIQFYSLANGHYTISIKAQNTVGEDVSDVKSLNFYIRPHFTETIGFKFLIIVSFLIVIFFIYKNRINQLKELEMVRSKIAADLHDDVASSVSSISYYSDFAKNIADQDKANLNNILEKIGDISRETLVTIREIIWTTHIKFDDLDSLKHKIKEFCQQICVSKVIGFEWIDDSEAHNIKLSPIHKRNIYLIIKESFMNAVKHSQCNRIKIHIRSNPTELNISVKDDGIGFDHEQIQLGNGLENLSMRTKELKGNIRFNSILGQGTKIHISIPVKTKITSLKEYSYRKDKT